MNRDVQRDISGRVPENLFVYTLDSDAIANKIEYSTQYTIYAKDLKQLEKQRGDRPYLSPLRLFSFAISPTV